MSFAACACCGCNLNSSKIYQNNDFESDSFGIIKFPICYHCNLNCAYCCHFSPIAPKYEVSIETFKKDVKQLQKITKGKVKILSLMGGEPLLHKDIEQLLVILNKYFPNSTKRITTNGLLLDKMPKSFWHTCKQNNIKIECSDYFLNDKHLDKDFLAKMNDKYNVDIKFNREKITSFELARLSNKNINPDNYSFCDKKLGCTQLDNGKIYPCSIISNIKIFNEYFKDYAIKTSENDYLDIYKISSVDEIFQYLKKPKELCKYCNLGHNRKTAPWKISERKVSEWYEI